ncbi:MAG: CHRD domain-containing protein [Chitinophagales bacterium]
MKKLKLALFVAFLGALTFTGCKDDNDDKVTVMKKDIILSAENAIPSYGGSETGTITMELFEDNTMDFTIMVSGLASSDDLTAAHIHSGDVVSTGDVVLVLVDGTDITFSGNTGSATITLTDAQVVALEGSDLYVNVHSVEAPGGLVRGQVDKTIDHAFNIALSPANEVPAIMDRNEDGNAYLRVVGSTLYYKVQVNNLSGSDAIAGGHIHEGTASENGGVFLDLDIADGTQVDVTKMVQLGSTEMTTLSNDALYVNIHSVEMPGGLMRGQIR